MTFNTFAMASALIVCSLCPAGFQLNAQYLAAGKYAQNPEWLNYTDGAYVLAFAKNRERLWIGTRGGLVQFDQGTGAKEFFTRANSALPDNIAQALAVDHDRNLWIGTIAGLARYDGAVWRAYHVSDSDLPSDVVRALAVDHNGHLWVGTWPYRDWRYPRDYVFIGGGLARFDGRAWTVFNTKNSPLPHDAIEALAVDEKGNLWVGTDGGAASFDGTSWAVYTVFNSGLPDHVVAAIAVQDSTVWFGTVFQGVARFDGAAWIVYHTGNSPLPDNGINAIVIDELRNKWIATSEGLARFDGQNWAVYGTSNSDLPHDFVRSLLSDGESLWIATFDGLAQLQGGAWTLHHTSNSGLPDNLVEQIMIDKKGTAWMGSNAYSREDNYGLLSFDGQVWTVFDTSNSGLPDNLISALLLDAEENVWIGTFEGLAKFDGIDWEVFTTANSALPSNIITAVTTDQRNHIWVGTEPYRVAGTNDLIGGGLAQYDGKAWTVYDTSNSSLFSNWITALACDSEGKVLIGGSSREGGFAILDGQNWSVYNTANSPLPDNDVLAIALDQYENRWLGTRGGGLVVFREGGIVSRVQQREDTAGPRAFRLFQNYPNPFNPTTAIRYFLPQAAKVDLKVYNVSGREIRTLVDAFQVAGSHTVVWEGRDDAGREVGSGIYFYKLQASEFTLTSKMTLIR